MESVESLQISFLLDRPNHGHAISFLEEMLDHATNTVFLLYLIRESLLQFKGIFKIFLGNNGITLLVDHLESKITDYPEELGEHAFMRYLYFLNDLNKYFSQIDNKGYCVQCIFVNISNWIINEIAAK